jgi:hypothetical protein
MVRKKTFLTFVNPAYQEELLVEGQRFYPRHQTSDGVWTKIQSSYTCKIFIVRRETASPVSCLNTP